MTFSAPLPSARRLWLLSWMALWYVGLTLLKSFVKTRRLIALAAPPERAGAWPRQDVLRGLRIAYSVSSRLRLTNCLPRSLLAYRFLRLAGGEPKLIVGIDGRVGHAWVEIDGAPLYENPARLAGYRPILTLPAGAEDAAILRGLTIR